MPYIVVENGDKKGKRVEIPDHGTIVVGRGSDADIAVSDHLCSRHHFQVRHNGSQFLIQDLGSSNGTFVNDRRLSEETWLATGDGIQAGETQLTFLTESASGTRGLVGKTVGGYRILDRVGRGGMGTVYKANQVSLNRTVALKILSHKAADDPSFVSKFKREAQAAGRLNHPNIVQCYDVGSDGGLHYYSMEFIENGSVEDMVRKNGKVDPELALAIMLDAAKGLEYAEKKRLVHRDIKPDNLMVNSEGVVKIADLGLARDADRTHEDEGIFGTPHFISPEQAQGQRVDTRSDIYSLGASVYYILAGETPFSGENVREIVQRQINEDPEPIRRLNKDVPTGLAQLVSEMMAKDPENRPKSARDLVESLESLSASMDKGNKSRIMLAVAAVLVLAGIAAWWFTRDTEPKKDEGGNTPTPIPSPAPHNPTQPGIRVAQERRETEALKKLHEVQLEATRLVGAAKTVEAMRNLATQYDQVAQEFGAEGDFPSTESALKAVEFARTLRTEADEMENAASQVAEAEQKKEEEAKKAATVVLNAVGKALGSEQWATALAELNKGLKNPVILGSTQANTLSQKIADVVSAAVAKAKADIVEADRELELGQFDIAESRLIKRKENLVAGFEPGAVPGAIAIEVSKIETSLTEFKEQRASALAAALEQDQKTATGVRMEVFRQICDSFQPNQARTRLESLKGELSTEPWKGQIDRDLEDIATLERLRDQYLKSIENDPPSVRKDKIAVPSPTDPNRDQVWDLKGYKDGALILERGRGRFRREVTFAEFSPAELYRRVFSSRLENPQGASRDVAIAHILSGKSQEAMEFVPDSETALMARCRKEVEATLLVKRIRKLESEADSDPMNYLQILPRVKRFISQYASTLVFLRNTNGTTPLKPVTHQ